MGKRDKQGIEDGVAEGHWYFVLKPGIEPDAESLYPDPVDHVTTLWTNKTGLQGGLGVKRSCAFWMSEGPMLLQLDPLDHHFDPEDQAPTLWISAN